MHRNYERTVPLPEDDLAPPEANSQVYAAKIHEAMITVISGRSIRNPTA